MARNWWVVKDHRGDLSAVQSDSKPEGAVEGPMWFGPAKARVIESIKQSPPFSPAKAPETGGLFGNEEQR